MTSGAERKRERVWWMQRYLLNPPMKALAWTGLLPGYVLIVTTVRLELAPPRSP